MQTSEAVVSLGKAGQDPPGSKVQSGPTVVGAQQGKDPELLYDLLHSGKRPRMQSKEGYTRRSHVHG